MSIDSEYSSLVENVLYYGVEKSDRTETGVRSRFGSQIRFEVSKDEFPIITRKRVVFDSIVSELKWFLRGETNIKSLVDDGVSIWTPNAYSHSLSGDIETAQHVLQQSFGYEQEELRDMSGIEILEAASEEYDLSFPSMEEFEDHIRKEDRKTHWGELGMVYGAMWRSWPTEGFKGIDQIMRTKRKLEENPDSRRHVVSSWNPQYHGYPEDEDVALSPCHVLFQFWSEPLEDGNRKLHLKMYQRSADLFLGVPFNLTSYSLLLVLMSEATSHEPGSFIWTAGDVHIYDNHETQVKKFLDQPSYDLPSLDLEFQDLENFDASLEGYEHGPFIRAPIAT